MSFEARVACPEDLLPASDSKEFLSMDSDLVLGLEELSGKASFASTGAP
jgi:hypothetical protein